MFRKAIICVLGTPFYVPEDYTKLDQYKKKFDLDKLSEEAQKNILSKYPEQIEKAKQQVRNKIEQVKKEYLDQQNLQHWVLAAKKADE